MTIEMMVRVLALDNNNDDDDDDDDDGKQIYFGPDPHTRKISPRPPAYLTSLALDEFPRSMSVSTGVY